MEAHGVMGGNGIRELTDRCTNPSSRSPQVTVDLQEQPGNAPKVVMKAQKCRISGSDFVEQFDINSKFDMNFRAELKWKVGELSFHPVPRLHWCPLRQLGPSARG